MFLQDSEGKKRGRAYDMYSIVHVHVQKIGADGDKNTKCS